MKKIQLILFLLINTVTSFAQSTTEKVEMANALYQSGKIYVVVAVLSIIFVGIVFYLITLDRKISKLEKQQK